MLNLFLSSSFWNNHVDWTGTGTLIDRLKATPLGLAAKAFLNSGYFSSHIVDDATGTGPLAGTSGNDLIEDFSRHYPPVSDGAGSDIVVGWIGLNVKPDLTDANAIDIFVAAPLSLDPFGGFVNYGSSTQDLRINLDRGVAQGSDIGKDRLINFTGASGGSGNDVFIGSDVPEGGFIAGAGDDKMWGYGGFDRFDAGDGNDYINGGDDLDWLNGNGGFDRILGGGGDDIVNWYNPEASIDWNGDSINGDNIDGGDGNDLILGTTGNDIIRGGNGDDIITTSRIWFGGGHDIVAGGAGADVFQALEDIYSPTNERLLITDFENGVDRIQTVYAYYNSNPEPTYIIGYAEFAAHSHDSAAGLIYRADTGATIIMRGFTLAMLDLSDFT